MKRLHLNCSYLWQRLNALKKDFSPKKIEFLQNGLFLSHFSFFFHKFVCWISNDLTSNSPHFLTESSCSMVSLFKRPLESTAIDLVSSKFGSTNKSRKFSVFFRIDEVLPVTTKKFIAFILEKGTPIKSTFLHSYLWIGLETKVAINRFNMNFVMSSMHKITKKCFQKPKITYTYEFQLKMCIVAFTN